MSTGVAFSGSHKVLIADVIKTKLRNLQYFEFKNCSKIYCCKGLGEITQNNVCSKFSNVFCVELYTPLTPTFAAAL